ncbi:molybdopterin-guanine dinucleotide biosynthesis protein B [Marinospirillum sp. MEB164]|uniref:Molybdopterin-guanine dinucleotide biosynthesis protein B n=1 Tax=Marinospirillum alkalitolerans TaxID=3123374 RepID=A0ABW8PZE1_9GAMM
MNTRPFAQQRPPLLGFAAWSGTGKTTLLTALLPRLRARGLRLACIKHAHHAFDVDYPQKDSYRLRHAGAEQMLIASDQRWALMVETPESSSAPSLADLVAQLDTQRADLILVEGFKAERFPKIELHRAELDRPWLYPDDPDIFALASDVAPPSAARPWVHLNDLDAIEQLVLDFLQAARSAV